MTQRSVKVKVCGLTDVRNALASAEAGADWIGLNFHPASPRSVTVNRGTEIAEALRDQALARPVGLFVNLPIVEVIEITRRVGLETIQLHGDESPEYLHELVNAWPGPNSPRLVRAFRLGDPASVAGMVAFLDRAEALGCPPDAILVDAFVPGQAGGTGHSIARELLEKLPAHPRLILAGGLTPANVAGLIATVHPWMVDVASGVESSPGVKDHGKVAAFVAAVRGS